MTSRLRAALRAGAVTLAFAAPAAAQSPAEMTLAQEFLSLELAGWRLPDPVEECLTGLSLRQLEPMAFGNEDLIDQPELVDPPGPHFRIQRIETDPRSRARRIVQFEWLLRGPGGAIVPVRDSFVMTIGGNPAAGTGRPTMQREPERLVVRRECFGS
jgi:hypothetical protein